MNSSLATQPASGQPLASKTYAADFARHLRFSSPFENNRVSDVSSQPPAHNVNAIHANEFGDLQYLVNRAHKSEGVGAMLWGEPGVGKSHLIARLASKLQEAACVTFLHNVQVRSERLPRYVLKAILSQLARAADGSLYDGKLNMLLVATVMNALDGATSGSLAEIYQSYRSRYIQPAIDSGSEDQELVYEVLFAYFVAVYRGSKSNDNSPAAAKCALRWLTGDALDPEEIKSIGLSTKAAEKISPSIADNQGVEAAIAAVANLAAQVDQTFVLFFDQADNLSEEQVSAWARFAHGLIDHVPNLLVVTSGVRGRLLEMKQSAKVNEASWDRIAQCTVEIGRINPEQAHQLLAARLNAFLAPFATISEIESLVQVDPLFPLGSPWLEDRIGNALELRPRDVINWAQDRFRSLGRDIVGVPPKQWLATWELTSETSEAFEVAADLTPEARLQRIDAMLADKFVEQCRRRELDPQTLPADAENLLGLTEQLLTQCLDSENDYSLEHLERLEKTSDGKTSRYDLLVSEQAPNGQVNATGIKFIGTGSKTSTAAALRRIVNDPEPPQHVLVVTEERLPLQLGPKGREYLEALTERGGDAFGARQLSFDDHVGLDALQSLIGLAMSGDIEITLPNGDSESLDAAEVIEAHHRADRYRNHEFLGELLTEEAIVSQPALKPVEVRENEELQQFVLDQLSVNGAASTAELTDKYLNDRSINRDLDCGPQQASLKQNTLQQEMEQAAAALHRSGKAVATPQDNHTFVSLPSSPNQPIHFSVSQVRQAAACARLFHLDAYETRKRKLKRPRVSLIWQYSDSSEVGALGSLFHQAVEKFNDSASRLKPLHTILESRPTDSKLSIELQRLIQKNANKNRLAKAQNAQQQNFSKALSTYAKELAEVLNAGLARGTSVDQLLSEVFGDLRRQVDVTFHVGPEDRHVHVTGKLDFVFYDWRRGGRRIIDYKLTPGKSVEADLFQVCVYALMHHQQHGSQPDVALLYLHPERKMVELSWQEIYQRRHEIYDLLASMVEWQAFRRNSNHQLHPPGNEVFCGSCRYRQQCTSQLGAVVIGQRLTHWADAAAEGDQSEPVVQRHDTVEIVDRIATTEQPAKSVEPVELASTAETAKSLEYVNGSKPKTARANSVSSPAPSTTKKMTKRAESGNDAESKPDSDLLLGTTEAGCEVRLPMEMLPSHVALVGAAGSGKTWMAKVIVEEAVRRGVPVLAIDPQGDLVQFLSLANTPCEPYQDELSQYKNRVEPRIYTPGSSHATRLSIDPMRFPSETELASISNPQRREEEREGMLAATISNLVSLANVNGDAELQRTFLLTLTKLLLKQPGHGASEIRLRDMAASVMAPDACGMEDADCYLSKAKREQLGRKILSLLDGPRARLFRDGCSLNIDDLCQPTAAGKTPLNVVYLNALNDDEKQFFVASLANELYRWMITSKSSNGRAKLLVYLDEARDFAPAGGRKPLAKDSLIRLFAQGRKFGVAGLICTQSPRSVDYNIFSNCSTKMIGRLESAQDLDRVKEWFGNDGGSPPWLAGRKSASRGSFIGRWPEIDSKLEGQAFKGRPLFSLHEGAWSPDQVENAVSQFHK